MKKSKDLLSGEFEKYSLQAEMQGKLFGGAGLVGTKTQTKYDCDTNGDGTNDSCCYDEEPDQDPPAGMAGGF